MNHEEIGWTLLAGELYRSLMSLGGAELIPPLPPQPLEGDVR